MKSAGLLTVKAKLETMDAGPGDSSWSSRERENTWTQSVRSNLAAAEGLKEFTLCPCALGLEISELPVNSSHPAYELVRRGRSNSE
jgi:hypothetical protein